MTSTRNEPESPADIRDCVIVGGGAAGLSAALVLGRARLNVLVVDAGKQSNLATDGIGGMLGQDRRPPAEFYAMAREEATAYPSVDLADDRVVSIEGEEDNFTISTASGQSERARRILLATGMNYDLPDIPGIADFWGHSVFHCPFCHGWENRDRTIGLIETTHTVTKALLLLNWSDNIIVFTNGAGDVDDQAGLLAASGIRIEERPIEALRGESNELSEVVLTDGTSVPCEAMLIPITQTQASPLAADLGLDVAEPNPLTSEAIAADARCQTSQAGIFVAGDAGPVMPTVAGMIANGSNAAAGIVHSLIPAAR